MAKLTDLPRLAADKLPLSRLQLYAERGAAELHYLRKMLEAGALKIESPTRIAALLADIRRWGEIGMIPALNARRWPDRVAVIDDEGEMTFAELNDAAHAVANALLAKGVRGGDGVAILARNHRWFLVSMYGAARVGARIILLNTEFSGPQICEVSDREGAKLIIYDDEYTAAVSGVEPELGKLRALGHNPDSDEPSGSTDETLADIIERVGAKPAPKATRHSSIIILTSGTTGTPKGATRKAPPSLAPIGGVLSHVPFKSGEVTSLPAPMFHALGYLHATIAMMLGNTLLLRRRFKPATVLTDIEKHNVSAVIVVPVMLSRMLDEWEKMRPKPDLSSLRIVFVSGSQLGAELASRAMRDLGPVIYNLYGSTEIAFATIARPQDLSINPATVGPVVKGVTVKLFDENGKEVPRGEVGRIFVRNTFPFEGYTGGGHKQIIDGLMSSGDVGYFDEHGLLYVSGRDDEMIVSGGENVFPAEIEDLLSGHPEIVEATAIGVEDKEWGQRLRAFVVKAEGSDLDEDEVKRYVREHLARYKVPRDVIFLDELPRNPTGKILKRELRELEVS
ncbi:long-chain-fatty-acid--CoA ligase FadD2 [Mycolicibacterium thermoresistibile]|jgi:fatty-acyl-CoA synthase|uniref:Long-chain-fatty-acid--CoA ligase FadD13 n=2 Tax=Mycolicibacterium thermoresistibile TaxID=1797 RepID=G7CD72_MYCT3|nr:long-chain-fatty-acid--CoA ligase FadD2 [Mycolicibacterium thermoresistibile]EHI13896.1 acyl-CoA synthetase [Mycolicibacterium thermoresistibile ATCC 19527]MCV7187499.1 acyl-CoA synthetase [Mycolicibacterium thermoresistibile]GAT17112.1 acyl-CoA synthetase [Mycolicibacterium thermoresistibile]SNW16509.1 acyl-CoA synthetase [Mycolicibacterium thermoresistibile]